MITQSGHLELSDGAPLGCVPDVYYLAFIGTDGSGFDYRDNTVTRDDLPCGPDVFSEYEAQSESAAYIGNAGHYEYAVQYPVFQDGEFIDDICIGLSISARINMLLGPVVEHLDQCPTEEITVDHLKKAVSDGKQSQVILVTSRSGGSDMLDMANKLHEIALGPHIALLCKSDWIVSEKQADYPQRPEEIGLRDILMSYRQLHENPAFPWDSR